MGRQTCNSHGGAGWTPPPRRPVTVGRRAVRPNRYDGAEKVGCAPARRTEDDVLDSAERDAMIAPVSDVGSETLDRDASIPLYLQLAGLLRGRIERGEWQAGQKIPSENELNRLYGVSRMTARQVLAQLVNENLLFRVQGKGTFVAHPKISTRSPAYKGIREQLEGMGYAVATKVLADKIVPADEPVARALRIPVGERVHEIRRVRLLAGRRADQPAHLLRTRTARPHSRRPGGPPAVRHPRGGPRAADEQGQRGPRVDVAQRARRPRPSRSAGPRPCCCSPTRSRTRRGGCSSSPGSCSGATSCGCSSTTTSTTQ